MNAQEAAPGIGVARNHQGFRGTISPRYSRDLEGLQPLERAEEFELAKQSCLGNDEARQKLIRHNLLFVTTRASQFIDYLDFDRSLSIHDIIQWGALGLALAAKKYVPREDVKFLSYAVWAIDAQIIYALTENRSVRIKSSGRKLIKRYRTAEKELRKEFANLGEIDRVPRTLVAEKMDLDIDVVSEISLWMALRTIERIDSVRTLNDDGFAEYPIETDEEDSPDFIFDSARLPELLLTRLGDRVRDNTDLEILIGRFGLGGIDVIGCKELGERFGMTPEKISYRCRLLVRRMYQDRVIFELVGGYPHDEGRFERRNKRWSPLQRSRQ